jgi:hypothetical protein
VKRWAPIPYSRDCQKNEQLTEHINTRTQNDQNKKFNKHNEVVDQNGHGSAIIVISQQVFLQLFLIIFQFILTTISHRLE